MRGRLGTGHLHRLLFLLCPWVEGGRVDGAGSPPSLPWHAAASAGACGAHAGREEPAPPSLSASALLAGLQQEPPALLLGTGWVLLPASSSCWALTAVPGCSLWGSQLSVPGIGFTHVSGRENNEPGCGGVRYCK